MRSALARPRIASVKQAKRTKSILRGENTQPDSGACQPRSFDTVSLIQRIAEEKILAAIAQGELDDLPGNGRPLALDDDSAVPAELRVGYRLLKNAGCLPPELELRREIHDVEALLLHVASDDQAQRLSRRLRALKARLATQGHGALLVEEGRYRDSLLRKLGEDPTAGKST